MGAVAERRELKEKEVERRKVTKKKNGDPKSTAGLRPSKIDKASKCMVRQTAKDNNNLPVIRKPTWLSKLNNTEDTSKSGAVGARTSNNPLIPVDAGNYNTIIIAIL